jgi:hypothetical protein
LQWASRAAAGRSCARSASRCRDGEAQYEDRHYDFSQTAIPTDNVDEDYLLVPRRWDIGNIMKFMLFIGPISSIFDYVTYFTMIYAFGAWDKPALFQTGWFVESLLTRTLIIHIIRTAKIPFFESLASPALITTSLITSKRVHGWVGVSFGVTEPARPQADRVTRGAPPHYLVDAAQPSRGRPWHP